MVSFLRQAIFALALLAPLSKKYALVVLAQSNAEICAKGLPRADPCFNVQNNWEVFRLSINLANEGQSLKYCPFLIKNVALPATPMVKATFGCSVPGACIIRGPGRHILIQEPTSEILFYGFVFQNATDTAIRVAANATKTQTICRNYFEWNSAIHGGAIRTDPNSNVIVKNCQFHGNFARVAGAISNHGKMLVAKSTFNANRALDGGAIGLNGSATLTLAFSKFFNNEANQGPNLYLNGPDDEIDAVYRDAGSNIDFGSSCGGLYHIGNTTTCIEFLNKTIGPTYSPSIMPSDVPSLSPSRRPTQTPTVSAQPTRTASPSAPSAAPSVAPTVETPNPTASPTLAPTTTSPSSSPSAQVTYTPPLDPSNNLLPLVSRSQPLGYYNFNAQDPDFGPDGWWNVDTTINPYSRYADLEWDTTVNECGNGGFQSPIDLYITTTLCQEKHQLRTRGGNWKNLTRAGDITFEVTPTRLWLQISGNGTAHPIVDAAHGYDPVFANHIEVTVPSLHTFNGRRYDAELSVYSVYSKLHEVIVVSVVIDASENVFNLQFQKLLKAWSQVTKCGLGNGRRLREMDVSDEVDDNPYRFNRVLEEDEERRLLETIQIDGEFNIFDNALFPSIYFFGYPGSLVVPPCTKSAEWRILDVPMNISWAQLSQVKRILRRGPCQDHPYRDGLNNVLSRPLQPATSLDPVWHCTAANYLSDCQRYGRLCPAPGYNGPPGPP